MGQYNAMFYILVGLVFIIFFIIGAIVFSYVNLVVRRLPVKESVFKGGNKCPKCGCKRKLKDSIPVLSHIFSGGRCRYCKEKLPKRDILIELMGGVISVILLIHYGVSPAMVTMFLLYTVLAIITFIDADTQEIPPVLNGLLLVIGVVSIWTMPHIDLLERVIGMFCISLPLYLIVLVIPDGFGGGDIKMMFAIGFFLGWKGTVAAFFIGVILGGVYGCFVLFSRKMGRKDHFALGPFLSVGIALSAYAGIGAALMNTYLGNFKITP